MKKVRLHITTYIKQQQQKLQQTCEGSFFQKGTDISLMYREQVEQDTIANTIKLTKGKATIIRNGSTRMRQEFIVGQWTSGQYATPYGVFEMRTKASRVSYHDDEFYLEYQLQLNGQNHGSYLVSIRLEELAEGTSE